MRILITGGGGFLGRGLLARPPRGSEVHATERRTPAGGGIRHRVELSDRNQIRELWTGVRPDLVIHTAYSMDAGERDILQATRNVVDASLDFGSELIHLSTDLVLDGESAPYPETAEPCPVHEYGRWKAEAEAYVRQRLPTAAIVRTSLITSFDPLDPRSAWVAAGLRGESPLTLYADEIRCPIARDDLVAQLWEIAALPPSSRAGVWHLAGPEALSRFALAGLVASWLGLSTRGITPARSRDAGARRPRDLRLLTARADRDLRTRPRALSELLLDRVAARPGGP